MKYIILAVVAVILIFSAVFLLPKQADAPAEVNNSSANQEDESSNTPQPTTSDKLIIGNSDAKITIIEYIDFKCPICNSFHQTVLPELREKYVDPGLVKLEIRNLPIIGPDSPTAAMAMYCSADQGKFIEMHDATFNHMHNNYYSSGNFASEYEDILTSDQLAKIAKTEGLDDKQLKECIDSKKFEKKVKDDIELANKDGASGTPTFIIGEQKVTGFQQFSVMKTLIELELN